MLSPNLQNVDTNAWKTQLTTALSTIMTTTGEKLYTVASNTEGKQLLDAYPTDYADHKVYAEYTSNLPSMALNVVQQICKTSSPAIITQPATGTQLSIHLLRI